MTQRGGVVSLVFLLWLVPSLGATRVNDSSSANESKVLPGPNGEWIVVYDDSSLSWAIARFNRDGTRLFGPTAIEASTVLPFENFTVWNGNRIGWAYRSNSATNSEVWFQSMDEDGRLLSQPILVGPSPSSERPCCPDIEWVAGEFLVGFVAESSGGTKRGITLRRIDGQGNLLSPELPVVPVSALGFVHVPQVGRIGDVLLSAFGGGSPQGLYAASIDLQGNPVSGLQLLAPNTATAAREAQSLPDRTVVYYTWGTTQVWRIAVDEQGTIVDSPLQVGAAFQYPIGVPFAEADSTGLGVALPYNPGTALDIYLQRSSLDAQVVSQALNVSLAPPEAAPSGLLGVAHMSGGYGVSWDDRRDQDGLTDVYFATAPAHDVMAIGAGPDPAAAPEVTVRQPESAGGPAVTTFVPYAAGGYGANVGAGDVDADNSSEILTGPGPGAIYGPQVRAFVWRGAALSKVNYYAYGTLKYGVGVASAGLDADGPREILTGAGPGEVFGPHVRGWNYDGTSLSALGKVNFFAYSTLRYGVNVDGGDIDGDGYEELLTGPGPGQVFGSQLRGFQYDGVQVAAMSKLNALVYPASTHGLHVASGDVDGEGVDEIGCGPGPSPASDTRLVIYDYFGLSGLAELPGSRFEAFAGGAGGARLAFVQWWDVDFHLEVIASRGPLPGNAPEVAAFDDAGSGFAPLGTFIAFPAGGYGVTLAGAATGF